MKRIIAIDYGAKRVGIAVSDPLQIIAQPLTTIPAGLVLDWLHDYLVENKVDRVVVGMPTQDDGTPSDAQRYIRPFLGRLKKRFPDIKVTQIDESYSSVEAHKAMIQGGVKKEQRREKEGIIDRTAAAIILQRYLENKK